MFASAVVAAAVAAEDYKAEVAAGVGQAGPVAVDPAYIGMVVGAAVVAETAPEGGAAAVADVVGPSAFEGDPLDCVVAAAVVAYDKHFPDFPPILERSVLPRRLD